MEFLFLMAIASMSISMSSAVCFGVPHMLVGTSLLSTSRRVSCVFHSHEVCFVYDCRGVWNCYWCASRKLLHLIVESNCELRTFFLAVSDDVGLDEFLDFFGVQTLGALRLLHGEHVVGEFLSGFFELGGGGWL